MSPAPSPPFSAPVSAPDLPPRQPTYRPPWWLPGGHLQTIWPATVALGPLPVWRRERWQTPDGDFIDLDHVVPGPSDPVPAAEAPRVVLFHGLEGSSSSHYSRKLMHAIAARGWHGVVAHWRGCSGEPNRLARAYHSGDSAEVDWIIRRLNPQYAIGVSLGANALAKWLGEQQAAAPLDAAVVIAAPQDLRAGAERLSQGFSRLYCHHFLSTLKGKALEKLARYPGLCDGARVRRARTLYDFDDAFTAPVHGFAGAHDYWQRSSCRRWLASITVPTLVINALNDPFVPASSLASRADVARAVLLDYPLAGGHVGFPTAPFPGDTTWLCQRSLEFLNAPGRPSAHTVHG